ncbi:MAG: ABC transporter substrate-binding protein [Clostridia bacterium]|nr:ABC transporter substrate-binding protein [Clostridia bacterium]MBR6028420.1 ABC transporter substrate-binding protein [Clostridia bacterium]
MKKLLSLVLTLCMLMACFTFASAEDKVYQIGILQLVKHDALDAATQGFMDVLTEKLGADKVVFELQNAQGDMQTCTTIATSFANNGKDLIMANATPALQACMSATSSIPVLGTSVTDYAVALGDASMDLSAGTGINVSGVSDGVDAHLYAQLVKDLVPEAKKVSIVYCSAEPNSVVQSDNFIAAMAEIDPEAVCSVYMFNDTNDMQQTVQTAVEDCDALYIPTDNTAASNMTIVRNVCEPAKVPVLCGEENMTKVGGLATVSISYYDIGKLAGEMAYEILVGGADIAAMPIAYSANPVKKYSASYAEAIGFTMPEDYEAIAE